MDAVHGRLDAWRMTHVMRSGASCRPSSWVLLLLWHAKHRPAKPSHCARHRPCCQPWNVSIKEFLLLNQICHSRKRVQNPAFGVRGNQLDILGHHDHQQSHHVPKLERKHKSSKYIQDTASNGPQHVSTVSELSAQGSIAECDDLSCSAFYRIASWRPSWFR